MGLTVTDLPEHDRPRERLFARGAEALSDRELLAVVLRHGGPGSSSLDLAASLLKRFGSLAELAVARPEELASHPGMGTAKAAAVVAAFRLGRRGAVAQVTGRRLVSARDIFIAAQPELTGLRRERVIVLACDASNRLRRIETVSAGSIDRAWLPVREILNCVLRHDARAFAVAHNHPSGNPSPSEADRHSTRLLKCAAETVGLRFLAHIVVAGEKYQRVR